MNEYKLEEKRRDRIKCHRNKGGKINFKIKNANKIGRKGKIKCNRKRMTENIMELKKYVG